MTYTDKHIIEMYTELFESLNAQSKNELIENLSKSLKKENINKEKKFFKSFGAFASNKSAEEIIAELKSARHFKKKEIKL